MNKLYHWNEYNHLNVYEGKWSIIVGSGKTGYTVFANKNKKLKIYEDGMIDSHSSNAMLKTYKSKSEALSIFRKIENTFAAKSKGKILYVPIKYDVGDISDGHAIKDKGGTVVIYNSRYPEAKIHEDAHITLRHVGKNHNIASISKEKEAIGIEIRKLREIGLYDKNVRNRISRRLATYYKGRDMVKAGQAVRAIEGRIKLEKINK